MRYSFIFLLLITEISFGQIWPIPTNRFGEVPVDYSVDAPIEYTCVGNSNIRLSCNQASINPGCRDSAWKEIVQAYSADYPKIDDCVLYTPADHYYKNPQALENRFYLFDYDCEKLLNCKSFIMPNSFHFNLDTNHIATVESKLAFLLKKTDENVLRKYLRPFYMSKFEVTNKEYREFVFYVRDSLIREFLVLNNQEEYGEQTDQGIVLNWETPIDYNNPAIVEEFYISGHNAFRQVVKFDWSKLKYRIQSDSAVAVYPDTTCWLNKRLIETAFNSPMIKGYFSFYGYNSYPVVGVSYYQALAYLDWKTKQEQAKFNASGSKFKVQYTLPNSIEWDIASTASRSDELDKPIIYGVDYEDESDKSWITDLLLEDVTIQRRDSTLENDTLYIVDKLELNFMYESVARKDQLRLQNKMTLTKPVNIRYIPYDKKGWKTSLKPDKKPVSGLERFEDDNGVCYLGANVSEWLLDSYREQWKPVFDLRQKQLQKINTAESLLLRQVEMYFDSFNDSDGKLVKGGNWFDTRYHTVSEGKNAKVFVSPNKQYSTVGFRYVIHVTEKQN